MSERWREKEKDGHTMHPCLLQVHISECRGSNLTRGSSFVHVFGKVTALGVLYCFTLLFV